MARVLTGIQSTGIPHLGNLLGAIIPAIKMSQNSENESLFFIADLHSFTTIRDKKILESYINHLEQIKVNLAGKELLLGFPFH